jgi:hypothetical protein
MKEEFKQTELAATAEEIRDAVAAKSVTPSMVGGTLLALVNATGEVVDTLGGIKREHVKVRVRACDCDGIVEVEGAAVEIEIFHVTGFPSTQLFKKVIEVDKNGMVEFDVPHGFTYSVVSKMEGMGASFQLVFDATRDERMITLWHFPIGIFWYGQAGIWTEKCYGPSYPFICSHYTDDCYENDLSWIEDDLSNEGYTEAGIDETMWRGVLVSTSDTAFVIMQNNLSDETMQWSGSFGYGVEVPYCSNFNPDDMEGDDPWSTAQELAKSDYNGFSNTVKILRSCISPKAATWCAEMYCEQWDQHNFLPSTGQMYLCYLNASAINAIMQEANADGMEFKLFPYYDSSKRQWVTPNGDYWWWTSTQAGDTCSWVVTNDGNVYYDNRYYYNYVRAVSAFHFEY